MLGSNVISDGVGFLLDVMGCRARFLRFCGECLQGAAGCDDARHSQAAIPTSTATMIPCSTHVCNAPTLRLPSSNLSKLIQSTPRFFGLKASNRVPGTDDNTGKRSHSRCPIKTKGNTMQSKMKKTGILLAIASATMLAACGGGDGDGAGNSSPAPAPTPKASEAQGIYTGNSASGDSLAGVVLDTGAYYFVWVNGNSIGVVQGNSTASRDGSIPPMPKISISLKTPSSTAASQPPMQPKAISAGRFHLRPATGLASVLRSHTVPSTIRRPAFRQSREGTTEPAAR